MLYFSRAAFNLSACARAGAGPELIYACPQLFHQASHAEIFNQPVMLGGGGGGAGPQRTQGLSAPTTQNRLSEYGTQPNSYANPGHNSENDRSAYLPPNK